MATSLLIVSHSAALADGVVELVSQIGPDVVIRAVGGSRSGELGTDFDRVAAAMTEAGGAGEGVVVLTDLGSATITAETAVELLGAADVLVADAPFVEGAVAAAVAAQAGEDVAAVRRAAESVVRIFASARPLPEAATAGVAGGDELAGAAAEAAGAVTAEDDRGLTDPGEAVERRVRLENELGLHARSAAMLARVVSGFDAVVTLDGADATSVFALMTLGLGKGDEFTVRASGPQAADVLDAVAQIVADGFGEE